MDSGTTARARGHPFVPVAWIAGDLLVVAGWFLLAGNVWDVGWLDREGPPEPHAVRRKHEFLRALVVGAVLTGVPLLLTGRRRAGAAQLLVLGAAATAVALVPAHPQE